MEKPSAKAFDDPRRAAATGNQAGNKRRRRGAWADRRGRLPGRYVDAKRARRDRTADDARPLRAVWSTAGLSAQLRLDKLTTTRVRACATLNCQRTLQTKRRRAGRRTRSTGASAASKAALNMALTDRLVATDAGWKTVTAFGRSAASEKLFLTREQRDDLIDLPWDTLGALRQGSNAHGTPARGAGGMQGEGLRQGRRHSQHPQEQDRRADRSAIDSGPCVFGEQVRSPDRSFACSCRMTRQRTGQGRWKKPSKAAVTAREASTETVTCSLRHAAISELLVTAWTHTVARSPARRRT